MCSSPEHLLMRSFVNTQNFSCSLSSLFHSLFPSVSVNFSSHFMLEYSFISPALAVVIVPLALLTLDCFANYVSMIPASSYGHNIMSQVRSVCHLFPDVMETLIITAAYVKCMLDMNKIFSSPLNVFLFPFLCPYFTLLLLLRCSWLYCSFSDPLSTNRSHDL